MRVPGSCGYPVIGDSSIEFYRDPEGYISRRMKETASKVFQSRLLNQKTVFICSYEASRELLVEKWKDFEHGYRTFLFNSYGDNILFENGESAAYLRQCMMPVFQDVNAYEKIVEETCSEYFSSFATGMSQTDNIYEDFKALMTKLCLQIFLDFESSSPHTIKSISELSTLHWHGIISVPVSLKIPFAGESGWRKAVEAKEELLSHIREKVSAGLPKSADSKGSIFKSMLKLPFKNIPTDIEQHVLLFISALIPKAFSSIITSFILELSGESQKSIRERASSDKNYLEKVLLEIQRLYPPFFGGRRIATCDTQLDGFDIPKGYAVLYVSYFAHRDEEVFVNPDDCNPDRWNDVPGPLLAADKTFTFGRGERQCIGHKLIQHILLHVTSSLVKNYDWSLANPDEKHDYKMLPVARPSELAAVIFKRK